MPLLPLALIPLCSLLNHERGQGSFPANRILSVIGMGFLYGLIAAIDHAPLQSLLLGGAAVFGLLLWAIPPWGVYFSALTGYWPSDNSSVGWIDAIGKFLIPYVGPNDISTNRERGTICMCLRGGYLYPLFVCLGLLLTPWALLIGLGCFTQGIAYRISPSVYAAEFIFGAVIGAMLAATLITGGI
jgi:hypothetical protein